MYRFMGVRLAQIRLTAESKKMLTELQSRWPLLSKHAINRYALEEGLRNMMGMPTLLPGPLVPKGGGF